MNQSPHPAGPSAFSASDASAEQMVSGRWIVAAMLGFALLVTGAMGTYWHFYTLPFRDLQSAIAAEFPGSSPRAIGGRVKGRSDQPATLRIVVRSPFDPTENDEAALQMSRRLVELARTHTALEQYELLEIHLYHRVQQQETPYWSRSLSVRDWIGEASESPPSPR